MRIPAHLVLSRHRIFYLRWPIPKVLHPLQKRSHLKLSLQTRDPQQALQAARALCYLGNLLLEQGSLASMTYAEIRAVLTKHFSDLLRQRKAAIASDGPLHALDVQALENGAAAAQQALTDGSPIDMMGSDHALLERFTALHGLPITPASPAYPQLRKDLAAAYRDFCRAVLSYNSSLEHYDFSPALPEPAAIVDAVAEHASLKAAAEGYTRDRTAGEKWTRKTEGERLDHLALLYEILGEDTDIASVSKQQARNIKELLMKLPKNRHKRPETRGLSLEDAIANAAGQTLSTVTINKYLQTYTGLFNWACRNGYVSKNVFEGLAIQKGKRMVEDHQRLPFNEAQMSLILGELVNDSSEIVGTKKAWRKWGTLIAAYTGARLNEICQLNVADIKSKDQIDYFDFNDIGEFKSLKAPASRRLVPVHSKLIELGFMEYVKAMRDSQSTRLFPDFSYCQKNGWGRKLGHWFNQVFLRKLGIKSPLLVFHSFRHTAVDKFNKAGVQEPLIKCVIGHEQAGVTQIVYGKLGFSLAQLRDTVEALDHKIGN